MSASADLRRKYATIYKSITPAIIAAIAKRAGCSDEDATAAVHTVLCNMLEACKAPPDIATLQEKARLHITHARQHGDEAQLVYCDPSSPLVGGDGAEFDIDSDDDANANTSGLSTSTLNYFDDPDYDGPLRPDKAQK